MRTFARPRQSGLTLIELLVTIIIAGIAFAAMVPVVVQALQTGQGDRARAIALSVAQDRVEKVRELGYEELTTGHLADSAFHFGLFGPTSNGPDGTTDRVFDVTYVVTEIPVSQSDTRIAYKTVTVTVNWRGAPYPHKSVSLSTVVYRQSAGPRIVDASLDVNKLDVATKMEIAMTPIRVSYFVDEADLPTMEPKTFGIPPNQHTLQGRVEISVSPGQTFKVPYGATSLFGDQPAGTLGRTGNEFYVYWASSAGGNGAGDGYYSFSARAFSTLGYVGEASTLIGSMKVETGPPPAVTNLTGSGAGTAGNDGVVNLQWTASTATDLDHYVVFRYDANGQNKTQIAGGTGWMATGAGDSGLTFGATYQYEVVAVDWVGKTTSSGLVSVTIDTSPKVAPAAPTQLKADLSGTSATLTWLASPSSNVAGYHVWVNDGTASTLINTIPAGQPMTASWDQGAGTMRYYTVKAYRSLSPDSAAASVAAPYPTGFVGSESWARVQTPVGVSYNISAKVNSVPNPNDMLKDLGLWYLGPNGTSTAVQVGVTQVSTPQVPVFTATSAAWNGQPAGVYQLRWYYYRSSKGTTSALTTKNFTCSGASGANTPAQVAIP
jgi:prepilin-type N-terminal cleavage/methylation domain-containing protein